MYYKSNIAYFIHVYIDYLVHFCYLHLDHIQVLEYVYELLVARVVPILTLLLHLHYLVFHGFIVLEVLAEFMGVSALAHPFGHHVDGSFEVVLLSFHVVKGFEDVL